MGCGRRWRCGNRYKDWFGRRKKTLSASRRRWLQTGRVGRVQNPASQASSTDSLKPAKVPPGLGGSTNLSSRATPPHRLLGVQKKRQDQDSGRAQEASSLRKVSTAQAQDPNSGRWFKEGTGCQAKFVAHMGPEGWILHRTIPETFTHRRNSY